MMRPLTPAETIRSRCTEVEAALTAIANNVKILNEQVDKMRGDAERLVAGQDQITQQALHQSGAYHGVSMSAQGRLKQELAELNAKHEQMLERLAEVERLTEAAVVRPQAD